MHQSFENQIGMQKRVIFYFSNFTTKMRVLIFGGVSTIKPNINKYTASAQSATKNSFSAHMPGPVDS